MNARLLLAATAIIAFVAILAYGIGSYLLSVTPAFADSEGPPRSPFLRFNHLQAKRAGCLGSRD